MIGGIRASPSLNTYFGGIINYYFDSDFNVTNLKSRHTRGNFDYGGPLDGYTSMVGSGNIRDQVPSVRVLPPPSSRPLTSRCVASRRVAPT